MSIVYVILKSGNAMRLKALRQPLDSAPSSLNKYHI
jgi:hypothetical protein